MAFRKLNWSSAVFRRHASVAKCMMRSGHRVACAGGTNSRQRSLELQSGSVPDTRASRTDAPAFPKLLGRPVPARLQHRRQRVCQHPLHTVTHKLWRDDLLNHLLHLVQNCRMTRATAACDCSTGQCMSPLYVGSFMKLALVTPTPRKSAISPLPWHAGLSHDT
ncbi:hypothetical protein CHLRE_10g457194v5 [Chlamydomonas reinhardtii]|uniref:Uncharacterized protein n=1 Tax=Chlamydomonas reinhardtii TaxID=3055 RepID=A0A2K3DBL4_CHLRE|nr:uncharacterized protein CHLRE_10g457194v5 [Chlamydomonas reinhardtii]PNW77927.1 hypothetical protein CHLRE_10g457194v5 [Chlamydomonas reinhardtii]